MMASPESYTEMLRNKTYPELILERERLVKELQSFERMHYDPLLDDVCPSRETVYLFTIEYLKCVLDLIHDKYQEEGDSIKLKQLFQNPKAVANRLFRKAMDLPNGAQISTIGLLHMAFSKEELKYCDYADGCDFDMGMKLHKALFDLADEYDIILDMSEHDGLCEGFPFNLDFVIRR